MKKPQALLSLSGVTALFLCLAACDSGAPGPSQNSAAAVPPQGDVAIAMDDDDIAGMVDGGNGPEAGVWVIAETDAFETRFARIVVTDDQGRYLVPDLPRATYKLWVRGYGLADSPGIEAAPGQRVDLTALPAPDRATAAEVYPAAYWYAMMHLPDEREVAFLPGGLKEYIWHMKNRDCVGCHQLGDKATRTLPDNLGQFDTSRAAWARRVLSGQAGDRMMRTITQLRGVPLKYLADWTDRIAAGELPFATPERPAGRERDAVITVRDWATPSAYLHDLSSTDRRHPTDNANGMIYGAPELSTDDFPILDPVHNTDSSFHAPARDADTPSSADDPVDAASPYWGDQIIWDSRANAHNPMFDQKGRVWYTARIRARPNPTFCRAGSTHPSAQVFPTRRSSRQVAVYDPDGGDYTFVDTCFSTHHLQFGYDADNTLWTSGDDDVAGWINTRVFDETGSAEAAVGWSPFILDTNGNGRRDAWVEPDQPVDPARDKRIIGDTYAVMPSPADGSVWYSSVGHDFHGGLVRFDPATGLSEFYRPPLPGFGNRGADIDSQGVVWASLGSGHLASFDRRQCKGPLNGPGATGDHCPEGWTLYPLPGPGFVDLPGFSVESSYYTWVDQHDTLGLGKDVPIVTGNLFGGVHALVDGKFVTLRVPYPLGFYTKGFDGRIDDPGAGWKGRGLWVPFGARTPWHLEGGKGTRPVVVHIRMRPDPLAK